MNGLCNVTIVLSAVATSGLAYTVTVDLRKPLGYHTYMFSWFLYCLEQSNYRDSIQYRDSLVILTIVIVDCLNILIVVLYELL